MNHPFVLVVVLVLVIDLAACRRLERSGAAST